jgi:preprotein translocase SecE subunit
VAWRQVLRTAFRVRRSASRSDPLRRRPALGDVGVAAGLALTLYCWRTPKIYNWATEVTTELSAVTWPKKDETQRSTHVVIMFSIAISICLAAFDFFWKFVTDLIL